VLESITISKTMSESHTRFIRPPAIRFMLSDHPSFISTFQISNLACERVCSQTSNKW